MTKAAVRRQYEAFLDRQGDQLLDVVEDEFGGGLTGRIAKSGGRVVLRRIESEMQEQGRIVVERAQAIANEEDDERFERTFLKTNPVYKRYDGDETEQLRQHLLEHFDTVSHDLAPLVASNADDFWQALKAEYTHEEAIDIVERHFDQAATFKRYSDGVFDRGGVRDRVIRIIERAEARLRSELTAEIDELYDA